MTLHVYLCGVDRPCKWRCIILVELDPTAIQTCKKCKKKSAKKIISNHPFHRYRILLTSQTIRCRISALHDRAAGATRLLLLLLLLLLWRRPRGWWPRRLGSSERDVDLLGDLRSRPRGGGPARRWGGRPGLQGRGVRPAPGQVLKRIFKVYTTRIAWGKACDRATGVRPVWQDPTIREKCLLDKRICRKFAAD